MATNHRFLVPWMNHRHKFISPETSKDLASFSCLEKLGVNKLSNQDMLFHYVLQLPSQLDDTNFESFRTLLAAISQSKISDQTYNSLSRHKIAVDGKGNLRLPGELFDHDQPIFTSAFGANDDTRFLHKSLRCYRSFWIKAGLRDLETSPLRPENYLECLTAMSQRMSQYPNGSYDPIVSVLVTPLISSTSTIANFNDDDDDDDDYFRPVGPPEG